MTGPSQFSTFSIFKVSGDTVSMALLSSVSAAAILGRKSCTLDNTSQRKEKEKKFYGFLCLGIIYIK